MYFFPRKLGIKIIHLSHQTDFGTLKEKPQMLYTIVTEKHLLGDFVNVYNPSNTMIPSYLSLDSKNYISLLGQCMLSHLKRLITKNVLMNSAYQKDPEEGNGFISCLYFKVLTALRGICQRAKFPANLRQIPMI